MYAVVTNKTIEGLDAGRRVWIWTKNPPRVKGIDGWKTWIVVAHPPDGGAVIRPEGESCRAEFAADMDGRTLRDGDVSTSLPQGGE